MESRESVIEKTRIVCVLACINKSETDVEWESTSFIKMGCIKRVSAMGFCNGGG